MYEKVILIGFGKIISDLLYALNVRRDRYGYSLECIEHEMMPMSVIQRKCEDYRIRYLRLTDREGLTEYLMSVIERTLIISAGNDYIFPKQVVGKSQLTIINFHNALLPEYPGRNVPSWAILNGEKITGATWHYVNSGVDAGDIIIQKECLIKDDDKAYELADRIMGLAYSGFEEIIDAILQGTPVETIKNPVSGHRMYYSYMIPGNGRLDLCAPGEDIYRLLRAADYGKTDIFPELVVETDDGPAVVKRYKKVRRSVTEEDSKTVFDRTGGYIYVYLNPDYEVRIKYAKQKQILSN